jgi:hypothetical protein
MYYSELFFKKDLYSITEDDVIEFFKQSVEETSILEFKSGNVSIEKIYAEVAALHNTQGGLLIIGSPIPKRDDKGKEYFDGDLTRSSFKNKDWLYQKLYSKISPPPVNLKIHDVKCDNGIIQIVDIPKSINPPHQCLDDGKYYIRFETETKFAPHGIVEALFNRRKEPIVDFTFNELTLLELESSKLKFSIETSNISDLPVINIKYLFNFYNVETVYSNHYKKNLKSDMFGEKMTKLVDSYLDDNATLVKGLSSRISFEINHFQEPFIIASSAWSDTMNLRRKGFLIFPLDLKCRIFEVTDDLFSDAIAQIIDVKKNYYMSDSEPDFEADSEGIDKFVDKLKGIADYYEE